MKTTSVKLTWNPPSVDVGLSITAYIIERRDVKYTSWLLVEKVQPHITSYCVQNLYEGNEYLFRVFAENSEGVSEPLELLEPVRVQGIQSIQKGFMIVPDRMNPKHSHIHILFRDENEIFTLVLPTSAKKPPLSCLLWDQILSTVIFHFRYHSF